MQFHTRDVARVESTWKQYVPSAVLHDVDPQRFFFDWHSDDLASTSLVRYDLAAEVRSTAEPEDQFLACKVDGADARVWSDARTLDARHAWLSDGPRVHAKWDRGARVTALVFPREALQRFARTLSGDDRLTLRVKDLAPRSAEAAYAWDRMFSYLETTVSGLDDDDALLRTELARHAASVTLAAFDTTFTAARHRSAQKAPAPNTVRRAMTFIDENAHRPITVDDIASAVHISTRGLQYAFRRALDISPAEALRAARLEGAHRELRSGNQTTIAAVARRWGFSHPSRFAAAYRDAYGVLPSATIGANRNR